MPYPELSAYQINNAEQVFSPGLVIFKELLEQNVREMVRVAGSPDRLRPHCKTHKTREIIEMEIELGIKKHKCATIAEAEVLADVGVEDVLLAYQLVGPNLDRFAKLVDNFPKTKFACLVDHPHAVSKLSQTITNVCNGEVSVFLDLNSGMNRTGILIGPRAIELYEMILAAEGLKLGGLHWYDGHNRQTDLRERTGMTNAGWDKLIKFRDQLMLGGLEVPRIVTAGTGSFPILAQHGEPNLELSPGTIVFHDDDMVTRFPEMNFVPALGVLTRVVSANQAGFLTLDAGHKSIAADQPFGRRLAFPELGKYEDGDFEEVMHSEEHLVLKTPHAERFRLGDHLLAIPRHACPVSAVHQFANVVSNGKVIAKWKVASRDRVVSF